MNFEGHFEYCIITISFPFTELLSDACTMILDLHFVKMVSYLLVLNKTCSGLGFVKLSKNGIDLKK